MKGSKHYVQFFISVGVLQITNACHIGDMNCYSSYLLFILISLIFFLALHRSIQKILKYPPTRTLSGEDRQLLWKFRFSLMSEKKALTKFLRCVEWSDVQVST